MSVILLRRQARQAASSLGAGGERRRRWNQLTVRCPDSGWRCRRRGRSQVPFSTWLWAAVSPSAHARSPRNSAVQFQRQHGLSRYETAFVAFTPSAAAGKVRPSSAPPYRRPAGRPVATTGSRACRWWTDSPRSTLVSSTSADSSSRCRSRFAIEKPGTCSGQAKGPTLCFGLVRPAAVPCDPSAARALPALQDVASRPLPTIPLTVT